MLSQTLPPAISQLDKLHKNLRDYLDKEGLESIDEVIELIINAYELEKKPSTKVKARKSISKYQDILSTQIEILKLTTKKLALQLKLDDEVTLEYVQDLIDQKSVILKNAQKKVDNTRANRVASEIELC